MIQVAPQMRILVAIEPADFRKGIDGLARVAREELDSDPFSGWIFRVPQPQGHGGEDPGLRRSGLLALLQAPFAQGGSASGRAARTLRTLEAHELQVLLSAGDFEAAKAAPPWRRLRRAAGRAEFRSKGVAFHISVFGRVSSPWR